MTGDQKMRRRHGERGAKNQRRGGEQKECEEGWGQGDKVRRGGER